MLKLNSNENRKLERDANGVITGSSLFDSRVVYTDIKHKSRASFKEDILEMTKDLIVNNAKMADPGISKRDKKRLEAETDGIIGKFHDYNYINANMNAERYERNPDNWRNGESNVQHHAVRKDGSQSEAYDGTELNAWMNDKRISLPGRTSRLTNVVAAKAKEIGESLVGRDNSNPGRPASSDVASRMATDSISGAFDRYSDNFHTPSDTYELEDMIDYDDIESIIDAANEAYIASTKEHEKEVDAGPDL